MKTLLHVFLFLAAFTLEVRVYAAEPLQQEPTGCLKTKSVCAVENHDERGYEIRLGSSVVTLDREAAIIRQSTSEIRIVKGTIWVHAIGTVEVSSEFGSARNLSNGDFWVTKTGASLNAMAVGTDVDLNPRGSGETLLVSRGLQNTLGRIGFDGRAASGIPMPIAFKDFVLRWGRLYRGPKKEFEPQVAVFHEEWERASVASAQINQDLYTRKLASVEDIARREAEKKARAEAEDRALREMFRRRVLNGM